jgi:uncharacterized protein
MAKAPIPGFAKTRLISALGTEGAAQLAEQLFELAVDHAVNAQFESIEICVTPPPNHVAWQELKNKYDLIWSQQAEGDLGQRMALILRRAFEKNAAVMIMGTDCPALTPPLLGHASEYLTDHKAVMIPAEDGGYVLLGLTEFHPSLFEGIDWSTDRVATQTLSRLAQLKWKTKILEPLHDIDLPEDLDFLPSKWLETKN